MRRISVFVVLLLAGITTTPARAYVCATGPDWAVCAYGTDLFGESPSSSERPPGSRADAAAEVVSGLCTYTAQPNLDGTRSYAFDGVATSVSTSAAQPELTDVKCTLTSPAQGLPGERPTLSASCEIALSGSVSTCEDTTDARAWPARPAVLCIDGYAIFGPVPVLSKSLIHVCTSVYL